MSTSENMVAALVSGKEDIVIIDNYTNKREAEKRLDIEILRTWPVTKEEAQEFYRLNVRAVRLGNKQ